jgi:hypothetical protein
MTLKVQQPANTNVEHRLVTFLDKSIEEEQLYFNIHRILLIIFIVLIIGISI